MTLLSVRRLPATGSPSRALRYLPVTALVADLALTSFAALVALWGRQRLGVFDNPTDLSDSLSIVGPLIVTGWILVIGACGGYREDVFGAGTDEYKRVLNATLLTAGLLGVGCYLAKFSLARGYFLLLFVVGLPALLLGRSLLRRAIHQARRQGLLLHRVLIAGTPSHVDEVAAVLRREPWLGYQVDGALVPITALREETSAGIPIVGTCEQVTDVVRHTNADVIFFAGGALQSAAQLREIAWDLEQADVQVVVAPSVTDVSAERVRVRPVGGLPLMHIDPPRTTDATHWAKRAFDVLGSAFLILAIGPVFLATAAWIKVSDRGPVFFGHTRIGRNGREFTCLKFRTMVPNAESLVAQLQQDTGQSALLFKMKDDPRITKPGKLLRRYSIDELPQLFNVLRGDMSLVGPRPQVAREVALYEGPMVRRLRVRPGMTGLWQVSGRNDLTAQEAVRLDLYYVDNWSIVQDLSILSRTFGAVFGSRGAY